MALTPKYKPHGFKIMYIGGMVKTIMTLLVYGGLYEAFELLFRRVVI
jgi:fructose-1,6-bisphosphatase